MDNILDKIHLQRCLKFTTNPIFFSFLVFMIWKTDTQGKKKGRAMIDVQKLNNLIIPNSYYLLLQLEIIANV